MKKANRYSIIFVAVALIAGIALGYGQQAGWLERDHSGDTLSSAGTKLTPAFKLDSIRQQMAEDLKTELDYYLDRHNVSDEGYEMVAAFANGKRHHETTDTIPIYNVGHWKDKKRQGTAISRDSLGRIIIGNWNNDTLVSGIRIDSLSIFQGTFADAKAEGHGSYLTADGHYFEGHWEQDMQEGFGLQLSMQRRVPVIPLPSMARMLCLEKLPLLLVTRLR